MRNGAGGFLGVPGGVFRCPSHAPLNYGKERGGVNVALKEVSPSAFCNSAAKIDGATFWNLLPAPLFSWPASSKWPRGVSRALRGRGWFPCVRHYVFKVSASCRARICSMRSGAGGLLGVPWEVFQFPFLLPPDRPPPHLALTLFSAIPKEIACSFHHI